MSISKLLIALSLITLPMSAFYQGCCDCAHFRLGAEALLWQPCTEPLHYGFYEISPGTENAVNKQLTLRPGYDWGFRIYGVVSDICDCNFLEVDWTHFDGTSKETALVDPPNDLMNFPFARDNSLVADSIEARQHTQYNKVTARYGMRLCGNNCRFVYGYVGGRWIDIDVTQQAISLFTSPPEDDVITNVNWNTDYCAGGLELGFGAETDLWCNFGASIRFGGIGAMGRRTHTFVGRNEEEDLVVRNTYSNSSYCAGAFEVRTALNYTYTCGCGDIRAEVGYELDYYFKVLMREQPIVPDVNSLSENFGIGGPFFGLTVSF